ncbi:TNFR/NGFR cysteine-rich region [Ostertagia ostertagi]
MRMWILTALFIAIIVNANAISVKLGDVFEQCAEHEFYDEETETCEPCTECKNSHYERKACTPLRDTICGWCGAVNAEKNSDFYRRCHWRRPYESLEAKKYEKEFRKRVMESILREDPKKASEEVIDVDELPDRRRLPPLPTDEYDDDEYADEEDVKYEVPSSEEELHGLDVVDSIVVHPMTDQYDEDEAKKIRKHNFAPISGDEFLRRDDTSKQDDKKDPDELLKNTGGRVNIVAIAIRNKERDDQTVDEYESDSSYALNCHFIGVLLYMICFVLLLGAVLKRCFKPTTHIPAMNFSDEQCASEISNTFFTNKLLLNSSAGY